MKRQACAAVFAACLCVACAGTPEVPAQGPGTAQTPTGQRLSPQSAMDLIAVGKNRKVEVASALGPAIVIPFDSGYEAWVYRWPGADRTTRSATELVVLFDPAGLVKKVRTRPGYAPVD
jgi:hypothetical protein